jgi:hypothetical protein
MERSLKYRDGRDADKRRGYMREYMRGKRGGVLRTDLPFAGVDGEGGGERGTVHPGYHAYFLLRAGESSLVPSRDNSRLTTAECLELLCNLPRDCIYVAYFFDYDVTKILEDIGFPKLKLLVNRNLRSKDERGKPYPVWWNGYQIDYIPRKEFKVRKVTETEEDGKKRYVYGKWTVINDVGSFFQCKFVEALEKWGIGTEEQRNIIRAGKDMRGNFDVQDMATIDKYNAMEVELLAQLMEKFRDACKAANLLPSRWQGPGLLAKAMMSRYGVPKSKQLDVFNEPGYVDLIMYAKNAYYGGRPELMAIGPIDREVYQYDINSAYPRAMLDVPCLVHGTWEYSTSTHAERACYDSDEISIVYGSFFRECSNENRFPMWYGLPVRTDKGAIHYPGEGRGWYWNFEVQSAKHQHFVAEGAWRYVRHCSCRPLGFVEDMYRERLKLGKDTAGIPLKLALNSLYGICAQSIGSPEYANPIWASFITAYCRTQIQRFIHSSPWCREETRWCGKDIVMIATDSLVTFNRRDDIPIGSALGEWSEEVHPRGMFLIQPGLYFGSNGKRAKTRGVPLAVIEEKEEEFRKAFDRMVKTGRFEDGDVSVPQRLFVGIRYALQRKNTKLLGQWIEFYDPETNKSGKTIRFDWTTKRSVYPVINPRKGMHSYIETFPKTGNPTVETVPYSKDIGGILLRETLRVVMEDQPDWVRQIEPGELADGTA